MRKTIVLLVLLSICTIVCCNDIFNIFDSNLRKLHHTKNDNLLIKQRQELEWLIQTDPLRALEISDNTFHILSKNRQLMQMYESKLEQRFNNDVYGDLYGECMLPEENVVSINDENVIVNTNRQDDDNLCKHYVRINGQGSFELKLAGNHVLYDDLRPLYHLNISGGGMSIGRYATLRLNTDVNSGRRTNDHYHTDACSSSTSALGVNKLILFIRMAYSDSVGGAIKDRNGDDITSTNFTAMIDDVREFYTAVSYNKYSLAASGHAFTPIYVSQYSRDDVRTTTTPSSGTTLILNEARTVAASNGYDYCNYDLEYVLLDYSSDLGWSGLARLDERGAWMNGNTGSKTFAHEVGHNLNVRHARSWEVHPSSLDPFAFGYVHEYGDQFDVMGRGGIGSTITPRGHFQAFYKTSILGWLNTGSNTADIDGTTSDATEFVLHPIDQTTTENKINSVRMILPSSGRSMILEKTGTVGLSTPVNTTIMATEFWWDYRTAYESSRMTGPRLHWTKINAASVAIDFTPLTSSMSDGQQSIGTTFSQCSLGYHVTVMDISQCPSLLTQSCTTLVFKRGYGAQSITLSFSKTAPGAGTTGVAFTMTINTNAAYVFIDHGDGTRSTATSLSHTYTNIGVYQLVVIATNLDGAFTKKAFPIHISSGGVSPTQYIAMGTQTSIHSSNDVQTVAYASLPVHTNTFSFTFLFRDDSDGEGLWQRPFHTSAAGLQLLTSGQWVYGFDYGTTSTGSYSTGSASGFSYDASASTGTWMHVALVIQSGSIQLYFGGSLYRNRTTTGTVSNVGSDLTIGRRPSYSTSYNATYKWFRFYNWALSAADVAVEAADGNVMATTVTNVDSFNGCTDTPSCGNGIQDGSETGVDCGGNDCYACNLTPQPTPNPTPNLTDSPTESPTESPTNAPTPNPTPKPSVEPTESPTNAPTEVGQTLSPTESPTESPTASPTQNPTDSPTASPTQNPTPSPTTDPCNGYASCNANGYCISPTGSPECQCKLGYESPPACTAIDQCASNPCPTDYTCSSSSSLSYACTCTSCTVEIENAVRMKLKFDITFPPPSSFDADFLQHLSNVCGIDIARINIVKKLQGSVIVDFRILPPSAQTVASNIQNMIVNGSSELHTNSFMTSNALASSYGAPSSLETVKKCDDGWKTECQSSSSNDDYITYGMYAGALVLIVLLVVCVYKCCRRRRQRRASLQKFAMNVGETREGQSMSSFNNFKRSAVQSPPQHQSQPQQQLGYNPNTGARSLAQYVQNNNNSNQSYTTSHHRSETLEMNPILGYNANELLPSIESHYPSTSYATHPDVVESHYPWTCYLSDDGVPYYYNEESQESVWIKPY